MTNIGWYLLGLITGVFVGWRVTVLNWRIKQTDFEIKYRGAMQEIKALWEKHYPELTRDFEEKGR